MENRLPVRPSSRLSSVPRSSASLSERDREYEHRYGAVSRSSLSSASTLSRTASTASTTTTGDPSRSRNGYAAVEADVFATPTNSRPVSSIGSFMVADGFGGPSRSFDEDYGEPIAVADGRRPTYQHSMSYSSESMRSQTPSLSSECTGPTLNRSNTTGTTNSSTLYSIPSRLSQMSSPPSPLQEIAPVRPQFNYSGHQQTLSIGTSDLGDGDPFGDDYMLPVGNGFAPYQSNYAPVREMRPHSTGSTLASLPPPYTQYPMAPKPPEEEGAVIATGHAPNRGSNTTVTNRGTGAHVPVPVVPAPAHVTGPVIPPHDHDDDTSGAVKEWKKKRFGGPRVWLMICASLLVGLAVGLGAGLGIGLHHKTSGDNSNAAITATSDSAPAPERTTEARFENGKFPYIPIGASTISPLETKVSKDACGLVSMSPSMPDFFKDPAIWSCHIPEDKPLLWNILPLSPNLSGAQLSALKSDPKPLSDAEWDDGTWGGYIVTSKEGEDEHKDHIVFVDQRGEVVQYAGSTGWREGMQGPAFWRQPLTYINQTILNNTSDHVPVEESYRFGIIYGKKVLLRESTLRANYYLGTPRGGDGTLLQEGEIAWMCEWENTLLEVEILVDKPSLAAADPDADAESQDAYAGLDSVFELDGMPTTVTIGLGTQHTALPVTPYTTPVPTQSPGDVSAAPPLEPPLPPPIVPIGLPDAALNYTYPAKRSVNDDNAGSSEAAASSSNSRRPRREPTDSIKKIKAYPRKVRITEYPPSIWRLKDVQGIDRTEGDSDPKARPGNVVCTKMVVTAGGGLRTDIGADGDGLVHFKQIIGKFDKPMDERCFCRWSS